MWKSLPPVATFQDVLDTYKNPEHHTVVTLTKESTKYVSMVAVHENTQGWRKHAINRVPETD